MKSRILLVLLLAAGAAATLVAADAAGQAELKKLEAERTALTGTMVTKRLELIKADADLQQLHDQIMALHRELALRLNGKPEMQQLLRQAEELDSRIANCAANRKTAP